jgi:hypothetical protein
LARAAGGLFSLFSVRARGGRGGVVVVATVPRFWACFLVWRLFQGFRAATAMSVVVAAPCSVAVHVEFFSPEKGR